MPSLPTLSREQVGLMREIEDLIRSDADQEEIQEKLEEKLSLEDASEEKLAGYYRILRTLEEHLEDIDEEIDHLQSSKKSAENALDGLEQNVKFYMEEIAQTDELYAGPARFRINKVGGRRSMKLKGDDQEYPRETKKYTISIEMYGDEFESDDDVDDLVTEIMEAVKDTPADATFKSRVLKSKVRDLVSDDSLVEYAERGTYLDY